MGCQRLNMVVSEQNMSGDKHSLYRDHFLPPLLLQGSRLQGRDRFLTQGLNWKPASQKYNCKSQAIHSCGKTVI